MRRWVTSPSYRSAVQVIRQAREDAGLTQRALAARLGRPYSVIANIERGERQIDVIEFIGIARALGLDELQLFRRICDAVGPELEL
jgi:transcriptional regulator with XRE-family HTH domain